MQLISKNKFIPWLLCFLLFAQGVGLYRITSVFADSAATSALVNNIAPTFTVGPADNSGSTTPINVGGTVTFTATATDQNSDQYYLAVCKDSPVPTPGTNGAPTCNGTGAWCVSSTAVNSGDPTSCTYTVQTSDAPSKDWYAFVCDKLATGALCSAYSQGGTGDPASPFFVNTQPTFTAFADDSPKNPGATVTWTSTASDLDGDLLTLHVCKTVNFASNICTDGEWCSNSTAVATNPSCSAVMPSVIQDGNHAAYGYIVDARGSLATGTAEGTDSVLNINNIAPVILTGDVALVDHSGSGPLTLTAAGADTTGFKVTFKVTDANGCQNASSTPEIVSALVNVRRSDITAANCLIDGNYDANQCYPAAHTAWGVTCTQDVGSCTDITDGDSTWTCTFPLKYYTTPTDLGTYAGSTWTADVQATDDNGAVTGWITSSTGNELNSFLAYSLNTSTIAYGNINPGSTSTDQTVTMSATGNLPLDENLSGTDLISGTNHILVSQQHYNLAATGYIAGTALSTTSTLVQLNVPKTTTDTPASKPTYWALQVPNPQPTGIYTGTNTIVAENGT